MQQLTLIKQRLSINHLNTKGGDLKIRSCDMPCDSCNASHITHMASLVKKPYLWVDRRLLKGINKMLLLNTIKVNNF